MIRISPCGPTALMLEAAGTADAASLAGHLRHLALDGVIEIVPAARTVLVQCDRPSRLVLVRQAVAGQIPTAVDDDMDGPVVDVPTIYDGVDLAEVGDATGLTVAEVIEVHSGTLYLAAFCGFTPGFTYLTGLPSALHLPRRADPRPMVTAGSVAIGADFTGVYPTSSPGGWHLLGHTTATMWDPHRARPAFIAPGERVRFVPVGP